MAEPAPELALAAIRDELARRGWRFALVGGLAVSVRAEVRFTRDVDLVVLAADDAEAESLIYELRSAGYSAKQGDYRRPVSSYLRCRPSRNLSRASAFGPKLLSSTNSSRV
jgi:hypothetical protein